MLMRHRVEENRTEMVAGGGQCHCGTVRSRQVALMKLVVTDKMAPLVTWAGLGSNGARDIHQPHEEMLTDLGVTVASTVEVKTAGNGFGTDTGSTRLRRGSHVLVRRADSASITNFHLTEILLERV